MRAPRTGPATRPSIRGGSRASWGGRRARSARRPARWRAPVSDGQHVMWGGRFKEPMDPRLDRLNRSLPVDKRLWREDLATNHAWVDAIAGIGVLTAQE